MDRTQPPHDDMEPTNNAAEKEIQSVMIHRKVCGQIGSKREIRRFDTLLTCILAWLKRGLNYYHDVDRTR